MSVQFGIWDLNGQAIDSGCLEQIGPLLSPYGPDGVNCYAKPTVNIHYYALHTTAESFREKQPHVTPSGPVITWDGRLDNRSELMRQLTAVLPAGSPDISIFAAAFHQWGIHCFARLIGD